MRSFTTNNTVRDEDDFVVSLYHKSKRNFWNPQEIRFDQDRRDWEGLNPREQETLLHLSALFVGGEEAVTLDLAPYLLQVSRAGRFVDAQYVATWTFEEAKHAEFFDSFHRQVVGKAELARFHGESYRNIFYQALPAAMNALITDPSPRAEVVALATYNMVVEGILAETGYRAYKEVLEARQIMPGLRAGLGHIQADEGRHIAFGVHTLRRLMQQNPETKTVFEDTLNDLIPDAMGVVQQVFGEHQPMPFDLEEETFVDYALRQLQHRVEVLNRLDAEVS